MSEKILRQAIEVSGGATKLARALGITHQAVLKWRRLPAERVLDVERLSRVSRHDLRPDIYGDSPPAYREVSPVTHKVGL
ncbi:Cro/CI family transcriptional regulator [Methylobacterium sp. J-090]|uniref:Cro/CI family transcriptional regulator n=1 Tax=Methylobacterium sp. J-090 TaxID=2836666 RepID=UPI001FB99141|nr:Cro/CI family transcriptional regulator [Methylobacterium sp. J-090]MCJ2080725.1 helix-turn-helix domain-containing protein [Methylobacterium sp. J-090]